MIHELTISSKEGSLQGEPTKAQPATAPMFDTSKIELLKNTICKGSTDQEFELFLHACQRTGLDPFMRQIHAVKRPEKKKDGSWGESMSIQTGIDGYRLIADRTGRYCPGRSPTYEYDNRKCLISATSYVKKQTMDGTWHEVSAVAFFSEYCQKTRDGTPTKFWREMAHGQLAKCAEALCLRKAFPADLSGIYTTEEMNQAQPAIEDVPKPIERISSAQADVLEATVAECESEYISHLMEFIRRPPIGISSLKQLPLSLYERVLKAAIKKRDEAQAKTTLENKDEI